MFTFILIILVSRHETTLPFDCTLGTKILFFKYKAHYENTQMLIINVHFVKSILFMQIAKVDFDNYEHFPLVAKAAATLLKIINWRP